MQAANFSKTQVFMFKHEIHPHEQTQMGWVVIFLSAMTLCWLLTRTDSQGTFPAAPQPHHIYAHPRQSHPAEGQPAGPCSCTVVHPEPSSDRGEQPQESLSFAAQGALATSASASTSSAFQKVRVQHGMRCELPVPWQRQCCLLLSAMQPLPLPCCWAQLAAARPCQWLPGVSVAEGHRKGDAERSPEHHWHCIWGAAALGSPSTGNYLETSCAIGSVHAVHP